MSGTGDTALVPAKSGGLQVPGRSGNIPPLRGRFQPGVSGNPNGRGKGRPNLATLVQRTLDCKIPQAGPFAEKIKAQLNIDKIPPGFTMDMAIQAAIATKALAEGDHNRWQALHSRIEGMPSQPVEVDGAINVNIRVNNLPIATPNGTNQGDTEDAGIDSGS